MEMESLRPSVTWAGLITQSAATSRLVRARWPTSLSNLRLTCSERRVLLVLFDMLALNSALLATLVLRDNLPFSWSVVKNQLHCYLILTLLWVVWALFLDCYDLPRTADASQSAWNTGRAALATAFSYLAIPFLTPHPLTSRLSSLLFIALVTVSIPAWRVLYAVVFSQPVFQQRVLVIGAGRSGRKLAQILSHVAEHGNPYAGSGYRMLGFVDDDPGKAGACVEGMPVFGNHCDLARLVQQHDINLLIVAITHPSSIGPELFQALVDCRERGVDVELMSSFYERLTGRVLVEHAGPDLAVVMPLPDSAMRHLFMAGKRLLDLLAAVVGLVALTLMAPPIALANAIWSPGPLFYRQKRVGRGGKPFQLYKFRSMVPAAEKDLGAVWACENDDRVTPIGRFLRKIRLDELPQCWNVLKGDMSLIGPRPERPEFVSSLVKEIPFYQVRHAVRPGITGWAQVRYRYGSSVQDALVKLEYDVYYIRRQSAYLELSILVKTAAVMLGLKGR
jgi:exopolysaccharide biosynthesis polyprenyl glycosylphosphotransferase